MLVTQRILALLAILPCASQAALADCNVKLKPTDTYKELTEKLECLSASIKDLEKKVPATQGAAVALPAKSGAVAKGAAVVSGTPLLPSGCFSAEPGSKLKGTYIFEIADKAIRPLCWSDGSMMLTLHKIQDNQVGCRKTDGRDFTCAYNVSEEFLLAEGGRLRVTPQKLLVADGELPKFKVTLEFISNN